MPTMLQLKNTCLRVTPAHHLLHSRGTSLLRPALTVITFQPTSALAPAALPHPCIQRILLKLKSDYSTPPCRTSNDSHLTRSLPGLTPTDPRRPSLPTPASLPLRSAAAPPTCQTGSHPEALAPAPPSATHPSRGVPSRLAP